MRIVAAIVGLLLAIPAHADWLAHVDDADVFGNKTVVVVGVGTNGSMAIRCNSEQFRFGYIQRKKEFDETPVMLGRLIVQADGDATQQLDVVSGDWNNDFSGFTTTEAGPAARAAIKSIGAAQRTVKIGLVLPTGKFADTIPAGGSTAAMNAVQANCLAPATTP